MTRTAVIIPAAGFGTRMKLDYPKQFHLLNEIPILIHAVRVFFTLPEIAQLIVVTSKNSVDYTNNLLNQYQMSDNRVSVVAGGKRRQDSVKAGLDVVDHDIDTILVHDGARPFVTKEIIKRCIKAIQQNGAAIVGIPVKDTLKKTTKANIIEKTIDRSMLWQAQTPQGGRKEFFTKGFQDIGDNDVTDEAMLFEKAGISVTLVDGSETNIKITRNEDLALAEYIMKNNDQTPAAFRIGHGFDAHQFEKDRELVLGGISIIHDHGLAGHSDGDVVTHALCDGLLGALGARDIGVHFPDSDPKLRNIYSITLLKEVITLLHDKGYTLGNADLTIICQSPRLSPHIEEMTALLANTCATVVDNINIKATTTEKMGYTGRKEGISCHAVVLIHKTDPTKER